MKDINLYATGLVRPKTTALFFDKLWIPYNLHDPFLRSDIALLNVPESIRMESPKCVQDYEWGWFKNIGTPPKNSRDLENQYPFLFLEQELFISLVVDISMRKSLEISELKKEFALYPSFRSDRKNKFDIASCIIKRAKTVNRNKVIRSLVSEYAKEGKHLIPIYLNPPQFEQYSSGDIFNHAGLEICLDFLPDISEDKLSWEQVKEMRKDKKSIEKLKRLRQWFQIELVDKTEEQIVNILSKKLDDYNWALKKHGVQTILGGSTSLISFMAGPKLLELLSQSPLAAVAGGITIGAGVVAWIGKKMIEKADLKRSEVAYIYEVNKITN